MHKWGSYFVPVPNVKVNAVFVSEASPPEGEPPVEWLLLTTLPIGLFEEACQVVEH